MSNSYPFIESRQGFNMYQLLCPVCEADGELGVRAGDTALVNCPNDCGARFIQRRAVGMFGKPTLEYAFGGN